MNQENGPQTTHPLTEAPASRLPSHVSEAKGPPTVSRLPRPKRNSRARLAVAATCLLLCLGGLGLLLWWSGVLFAKTPYKGPTATVRKEKLKITIVARGTLESASNKDIYCEVRSGTKGSTNSSIIKWIIDEGSEVKKGEKVMKLDSSAFEEQLKDRTEEFESAQADLVVAEETFRIQESQNLSDIEQAKNALALAELNLKKYTGGDYPQKHKDVVGRIEMAKSDRDDWKDRSAWSLRMVKKGLMGKVQADADKSRYEAAEIALAKVEEEKRVLEEYEKNLNEKDLTAKFEEAKRALDRVKVQAVARLKQAEATLKSKKALFRQKKTRKEEIEDEIRKCTVVAPQDGLVVYYVPEQVRGGGGSQQSVVAQGEPVREGQKMIQIPDLKEMLVTVRVPEAFVSYLHNPDRVPIRLAGYTVGNGSANPLTSLVAAGHSMIVRPPEPAAEEGKKNTGQFAQIRVDSFSKDSLHGYVYAVDTMASQMDWFASDVKVYKTKVKIIDSLPGLKPGMSAEVTIFANESPEPVLVVPLQAVVGSISSGAERKCFVVNAAGQTEERAIVVGMSNERVVEIRSGLKEGEQVVLNPTPLLPPDTELKAATPRAEPKFGGPKGKGKGGDKSKGIKGPAAGGKGYGGAGAQ
jgi:HlyD family secretion protein